MQQLKVQFNQLIEFLIPANLKQKPEIYWRAKMYIYISIFLFLFIIFGITIEFTFNIENTFPFLFTFLACIFFPFLLKITNSLHFTINSLVAVIYLILFYQSLDTGGLYSIDYVGSIMCPLIAFVLSGKRSGFFWSMMYILTGIGLTYREYHAPVSYLYQFHDYKLSYFFSNNAINFLIINMGIVHIYISVQNLVIRLLEEQRAKSEQQRIALETQKIELDKTSEELKKSNKELEAYAYVVSHDLKQPLRTVNGFSKLLERSLKDHEDPKVQGYLQYILGGTEEMEAMISDLLKYAKLSQNGEAMDYQAVNSNELFEIVENHLTQQIQETKAQITIENCPCELLGIRSYLLQLFQNLVSNAIKFNHPDRPPIVTISCKSSITHWEFSIQDNGIGIPEYAKEKVFEVFHRLHNKTDYSGTGIGLAICKKIVELHGGLIWLESEEGKGTCFYFSIAKKLSKKKQVPTTV